MALDRDGLRVQEGWGTPGTCPEDCSAHVTVPHCHMELVLKKIFIRVTVAALQRAPGQPWRKLPRPLSCRAPVPLLPRSSGRHSGTKVCNGLTTLDTRQRENTGVGHGVTQSTHLLQGPGLRLHIHSKGAQLAIQLGASSGRRESYSSGHIYLKAIIFKYECFFETQQLKYQQNWIRISLGASVWLRNMLPC